jgi:hypothetical protein
MGNSTARPPTAPATSVLLAVVLATLLAACGAFDGSAPPGGTPTPTITLPPIGGGPLTAGRLRLMLINHLGPLWYCDPDEYPVPRGSEQERAIERFAEMQAEGEIFRAIAADLDIDVRGAVTDAEKLVIYRLWKVAFAVQLDPIGEGVYRFDYLAQPVGGAAEGTRSAGRINDRGLIGVEQQSAAGEPMCPICLSAGTPIDTPAGPVAVEDLRLGDPIWTTDAHGRRVAGTVIALGSTNVPPDHRVIRLVLADGRAVTASPRHPLADGRTFASLAVGAVVDGSAIVALQFNQYGGAQTFDIVASGETGAYFSNGIPLGSTLRPAR